MKVQELRVGNNIKIDGIILTIDERTIFDFNHDKRVKEPIPLTEEILLKCGFNYSGGVYFLPNDFGVYASLRNGWIINNTQSVGSVKGIKYLHQLQNLYYALTQTELQIKL